MNSINWSSIGMENVSELHRVVEVFEVTLRRGPKIEIKIFEDKNGQYMGISNHSFLGPEQGDPYRSIKYQDSIERALNSSIEGLLMHDREDYSDDVVFYVTESADRGEKIYFDGCGELVSYEEVMRRREQYTSNHL